MDYVIIVAGGKGLRMGGEVPKQFLPVAGVPVLMRTMQRFREYSPDLQIILVLPRAQQDYWCDLCRQHHFSLPGENLDAVLPSLGGVGGGSYLLTDGGETRFHSVQNGLAHVPGDAEGVVGVHDGVRPFVSVEVIRRCYDEARKSGAAIPVVPVVETLRHIGHIDPMSPISPTSPTIPSETVPRSDYRLVQTPQCFDIQLLHAAYRQPFTDAFTDDASVVEAYGHPVTLVDGNRENIKITTPFDLKVADSLL